MSRRWHWLMSAGDIYVCYERCSRYCRRGDALLLMGTSVYLMSDERFLQADPSVEVFVLKSDLQGTGINAAAAPYVKVVDWDQVLDLLRDPYPLQQTWT